MASKMDLNKSQKYIYYYLRYTLMLYPVVILFAILALFVEIPWRESLTFAVLFILIIPIFVSFFILPGIIYEDGYKFAWHGFGKNQIHYNLFFSLTLGFGPLYIFFKKYDPMLKEFFRNNRKES
jgi:hypothetical protein